MDKLFSQQNAHDIGAEVHNVLDLPEGLLCTLEWRKVNTLDPVLPSVRWHAQVNHATPIITLECPRNWFPVPVYVQQRKLNEGHLSSPLGGRCVYFQQVARTIQSH